MTAFSSTIKKKSKNSIICLNFHRGCRLPLESLETHGGEGLLTFIECLASTWVRKEYILSLFCCVHSAHFLFSLALSCFAGALRVEMFGGRDGVVLVVVWTCIDLLCRIRVSFWFLLPFRYVPSYFCLFFVLLFFSRLSISVFLFSLFCGHIFCHFLCFLLSFFL